MTAATELSVQTDPSPLDTSKHQLSPFLPRESENTERKRPRAIQGFYNSYILLKYLYYFSRIARKEASSTSPPWYFERK
jgi:hypothetical protein